MHETQKPFSESGSSPPRRVTVTHVDLVPGSAGCIGHGLADDGRVFLFGIERRLVPAIAGALETGELVEVLLDGWSLIGWSARP